MHKLYHLRGLTNRERNFWDSFPVDLAETKETLKMHYDLFMKDLHGYNKKRLYPMICEDPSSPRSSK